MDSDASFETRINDLDLSLFKIDTQSCPQDQWSWLALQGYTRGRTQSYVYLEIGSHLEGSIQTHLLDNRCRKIFSIDKRPLWQPDERGRAGYYEGNSTSRMLGMLREIEKNQISKIVCFDSDARDGEHTQDAVISDFIFCERICAPNATIYFHDAWAVASALMRIIQILELTNVVSTQHLSFGKALSPSRWEKK